MSEKDARDVLADRIEEWAVDGDWRVYDYADRLIADLDAAGFSIEYRLDRHIDEWAKLARWLFENQGAAPDIAASGEWVELFDAFVATAPSDRPEGDR